MRALITILIKDPPEGSMVPSTIWAHSGLPNKEAHPFQTLNLQASWPWPPNLHNCKKWISVYQAPHLWFLPEWTKPLSKHTMNWFIGKWTDSLEKTLTLGKIEGEGNDRGWGVWMASLNRCEFKQDLGDGEGQGSLVCCSPWGCKEMDTTQQLNNSNNDTFIT